MKKLIVLQLLLLALSVNLIGQTKRASEPAPLVLTHVNVIDATGAPLKTNMTVVITGDRLTTIGKSGKVHVPKGARVVDATGKFLIPGLWDMHVHWYNEKLLPLFIANGVTGVRQMFGSSVHLEWRLRSARGELLAPRQFIASPIVDGMNAAWPGSIKVGNEEEARSAVRNIKEQGYDFVKVYNNLRRDDYFAIADEAKKQGISFGGHLPWYVTVLEAYESGQKTLEHLDGLNLACSSTESELREEMAKIAASSKTEKDRTKIAADWKRLDKMIFDSYDPQTAAALFKRIAGNQTWQVPTLVVLRAISRLDEPAFISDPRLKYMPKSIRDGWNPANDFRFRAYTEEEWAVAKQNYKRGFDMIRAMRAARVQFLAGTDALNPYCFPGFSLHDELALLVEAGLTPMEALQAATINPAKYMGKTESLGTIENGKLADLVLLDANPLEDIANTKRIAAVLIGGKFFDRAQLDSMLANVEKLANLKSIVDALLQTIEKQNVAHAVKQYRDLKAKQSDAFDFSEGELNSLGYRLLQEKKIKDSIEIFKLNVESFPQSANAYDSLAEAYMTNGDKEFAIQNYKKSLDLDPKNTNAVEMLKKLGAK